MTQDLPTGMASDFAEAVGSSCSAFPENLFVTVYS